MGRNIGVVIAAHLHIAVDGNRAFDKVGMSGYMETTRLCHCFQIESTGQFMIESQIAPVNGGLEHWRVEGSRTLEREIPAALNQQFRTLNLLDACEIEICSTQIKPEAASSRSVCGAASDGRVLVSEVNIVKRSFSAGDEQVSIEALDRFLESNRIRSANVSLDVRIGPRSAHLQKNIGRSRDRIGEPRQCRGRRHVNLM